MYLALYSFAPDHHLPSFPTRRSSDLLVEHLHEGDVARLAAIDERLHVAQEARQLRVPKVGPSAEGFLHVDNDQSLLHGLRASVKQSATSCGTPDSGATATADAYRAKTDTSPGELPCAVELGLNYPGHAAS